MHHRNTTKCKYSLHVHYFVVFNDWWTLEKIEGVEKVLMIMITSHFKPQVTTRLQLTFLFR